MLEIVCKDHQHLHQWPSSVLLFILFTSIQTAPQGRKSTLCVEPNSCAHRETKLYEAKSSKYSKGHGS